jgi:hypothetical protein
MGILRIYRKFYCVSTRSTPNTYTLITPTSLSAATYVAGSGGNESSTLIEANIPLVEEETGIFYADMDPELYAEDVTYDLVFYVQYTPSAPAGKKLPVRFRIKAKSTVSQLEYELGDSTRLIEIEISDSNAFGIEILGDGLEFDLSSKQVEEYINNSNGSGPIDIEIK